MKRDLAKKMLLLALVVSLIGCFFVACGEPADNDVKLSVWLDRYEEKVIELDNGNASEYSWTSADESIVKVNKFTLVAQSEGKTTVTGKKSGSNVTIDVTVNDSGAVPRASLSDIVAYVGGQTEVSPKVTYNGAEVAANVEWSFEIKDQSIATIAGSAVTGVKIGTTEIIARGSYKGVGLEGRAGVEVKPYNFIEIAEADKNITLYNVKDSDLAYREINVTVVLKGVKQDKPALEFVPETNGIVTFEGAKIKAASQGTTKVTVKVGELADEITVTVLPNYVEETFSNTVSAALGTTYEAYTGEVGGRTEGLFRYVTTDTTIEGQNYWHQRIVNSKSYEKCIDLYKNNGYRYFAFDMYITKAANMLAPIGSSNDTFYAQNNEYFDVDGIKIISDGKITNKLVSNKWITVVYDMRQRVVIDPTANADYYLALHETELTTYLSNIRYYLDDAFIPEEGAVSYEVVKKPGEGGTQVKDYTQASNGEFALYRGADESLLTVETAEVGGVKNAVKLKGRSEDFENNAIVIASSTGRTRSDSIANIKEKGEYLTFDLYVKKADSVKFSIGYGKINQEVIIGKTDFERVSWLSLISGNKQLHALKTGEWVTVSVEYGQLLDSLNVNANSPLAILVGTVKADDEILVNNARYYENNSYIPAEFADKAPAYIAASKNAVVTTVGNVDLSFAIENGEAGQTPAVVSDSDAVTVENGKITAVKTGYANITASFGDLEPVTVSVRVISSNEYKLVNKAGVQGEDFSYAAVFTPDSPEYQTATALKVKFSLNEDVNFIHVLTGVWGNHSDAVQMGDGVYQGIKSWRNLDVATNGFGAANLTVLDENGKVLGALNGDGIKWETGVTYTLIVNLNAGENLYFFTSDNTKEIEEYWWQNGGLYYKADVLNIIDFKEFTALYDIAPAATIVADKDELVLFANRTEKLTAFTAFARDKKVSFATENAKVVTVTAEGVVTAVALGKTNIVLSCEGVKDLKIPVSVVEENDITPSWGKYHADYAQGAIMDLSAYSGYNGVTFNMTFAEDNTYLTITDGTQIGWATEGIPTAASNIGPGYFGGVWTPNGWTNTISTDIFKIKDENGAYIDYTVGYSFKKGVAYTVEYSISEGRYLSIWTADNTDAAHSLFWSANNYYSNALEHVSITNVKGLWSAAPVFFAEISADEKSVSVGDEFTLSVTTKNAFGKTGVWASDNESVATVTDKGVVTAKKLGVANVKYTVAGVELVCAVKVCQQNDITPSWGKYHEDYAQGAIMDLSAYSGYSGISFNMTFAEDNTYLTITQGKVIGWATGGIADYASVIGPATFKGVWAETKMSDCIPVNLFRIKDENGAYIDYTQGYSFKAGVTYKVEYELTDEKHLSFWTANNDEHGIFWGINGYYLNALEHVTVSNVKGLWMGEPQVKVSLNLTEKSLTVNDEFTLTATVKNAFGQSGVWATDNGEVASVTSDGLVKALSVGTANVSYTVGGVKAVCAVKVGCYSAVTASWSTFDATYTQGRLLNIEESGYTAIRFKMTFKASNLYLTFTEGATAGWCVSPDNATMICPDHVEQVWGAAQYPYISFDVLKIKDESGNYIDYTKGYAFESGKTYTVEYAMTDARKLSVWIADNDTHGIYWSAGNYFANPFEYVEFSDFEGLF